MRQEREVPPEELGRHAIGAAEVAAIRHRDAEIAQRTPKRVGDARQAVKRRRSDWRLGFSWFLHATMVGRVAPGGGSVPPGCPIGTSGDCPEVRHEAYGA